MFASWRMDVQGYKVFYIGMAEALAQLNYTIFLGSLTV